jgi:hypothetical protein
MIRKCYPPTPKLPVQYRIGSRCDCDREINRSMPRVGVIMFCVDRGAYGITSCKLRIIINSGARVSILLTGNQLMFHSYYYDNTLYACKYISRKFSKLAHNLIARGTDVTKLTKKEIIAVLAVNYGNQETDKKNKPILTYILKA